MAWQNVSNSPVCTNRSSEAYARASSSPDSAPVNTAEGRVSARQSRSGPSPTMTSWTAGSSISGARRCTDFSAASLPTKPTIFFAPVGSQERRSTSERLAGLNSSVSTPRPQWRTLLMPWDSSMRM